MQQADQGGSIGQWIIVRDLNLRAPSVNSLTIFSLMNFGKFMELVLYSDQPTAISPSLCEHTSTRDGKPHPRKTILRHFIYGSFTLTFGIFPVENMFTVQMPRFQVVKSHAEVTRIEEPPVNDQPHQRREEGLETEREGLRLDMTHWWKKLKDHLDKLVSVGLARDLTNHLNVFAGRFSYFGTQREL